MQSVDGMSKGKAKKVKKRKKINFVNLGEKINEGIERNLENYDSEEEEFNIVKRNYRKINEVFASNDITEDELRYAMIENVVFIFHFYSKQISQFFFKPI